MAKEIERKFLIRNDDWRHAVTGSITMEQCYLATMDDRSVRVRIRDNNNARLTVKVGQSNLIRDEFEYTIPVDDAREMMTLAVGKIIVKTRHLVEHEGFVWEIDVFDGHLKGLFIAEVELKSLDQDPALPPWVGEEVTGDRRFSNQMLATDPATAPGVLDAVSS